MALATELAVLDEEPETAAMAWMVSVALTGMALEYTLDAVVGVVPLVV